MLSFAHRTALFVFLALALGASCHAGGTVPRTGGPAPARAPTVHVAASPTPNAPAAPTTRVATPTAHAAASPAAHAPASPTAHAPASPVAHVAASPTVHVAASPRPRAGGVQPLSSLSRAAAEVAQEHPGQVGVSVVLPHSGETYAFDDERPYPMASVAKVVILLTALHIRERLDLPISASTMSLLTSMITESDNDSADDLWAEVGGGAACQSFVESAGIGGIAMSETAAWGDSTATPRAVAVLFAKLVTGEMLDAPDRALALTLLASVAPDQAWGARAAFEDDAVVGLKNGWVPDGAEGWYMHSAAVDESDRSHPVVVVMTAGAEPLVAIDWIQTIAAAVGAALPRAVAR